MPNKNGNFGSYINSKKKLLGQMVHPLKSKKFYQE